MKILYNLLFTSILFCTFSTYSSAQVTGLKGWNIFVDPGHSQNENVGIYGYSEAHKVLRVGLYLQHLLLTKTDIDTVFMSRTDDQQYVGLSQRTDLANSLGADWYHSIHSDASSDPNPNSTLLLWGQYQSGLEKIPNGGKAMSDIITPLLSAGYRISTRGSIGDCTFYGCSGGPYLAVNRQTNMPSELSEAGFHTNPWQNQLNMNDRWKRLEAYTLFWSILKYFNIQRPTVGIATGIISDSESSQPLNGAVISIDGQVDTTDTYASLFHLYSTDPNELHNGFYFFENLSSGTHSLTVNAVGYEPFSGNVAMVDSFFTFNDVHMISKTPPYVVLISAGDSDSLYPGLDNITINFSRPMDTASVDSKIIFSPGTPLTFNWSGGNKILTILTSSLIFNTNYHLTISGKSFDNYSHLFDGNHDGTGGDDYTYNFVTKVKDVTPPIPADIYPPANASGIELTPIIRLSFDEKVNTTTLSGKLQVIRDSDQAAVTGTLKYFVISDKGVLILFVRTPLAANQNYSIKLAPGVQDIFGNAISSEITSSFKTGNQQYSVISSIDNFDNGIGNWWVPGQSGSTAGTIPEFTNISQNSNYINFITSSYKSLNLNYAWDTTASSNLIREYYSPATPSFNSSNILQAYLFGDGSGNKFRFAVKDNTNTIEVSPWFNINWIGWKVINWDMTNDGTGAWIGNGILENPLSFDSFQLGYNQGAYISSSIYFDDLRVVNKTTVDVRNEKHSTLPSDYMLGQNYPNPFNPSTQIKFALPQTAFVKLEIYNLLGQKVSTLLNEQFSAGYHTINFNANYLSSGIYIYTLTANNFISSKKMLLLK